MFSACFSCTYTKIGTIKRSSMAPMQEWHANSLSVPNSEKQKKDILRMNTGKKDA